MRVRGKTEKGVVASVTRLGDFLHFGQPFKAGGNNYFTLIAHIVRQFLKRCQNHSFLVKSFLGNFYRQWAIFIWSHWLWYSWQSCRFQNQSPRNPVIGKILCRIRFSVNCLKDEDSEKRPEMVHLKKYEG